LPVLFEVLHVLHVQFTIMYRKMNRFQ